MSQGKRDIKKRRVQRHKERMGELERKLWGDVKKKMKKHAKLFAGPKRTPIRRDPQQSADEMLARLSDRERDWFEAAVTETVTENIPEKEREPVRKALRVLMAKAVVTREKVRLPPSMAQLVTLGNKCIQRYNQKIDEGTPQVFGG